MGEHTTGILRGKTALTVVAMAFAIAVLPCGLAGVAQANSPILHFSAQPSIVGGTTQAGGHSNLTTEWRFGNHTSQPNPPLCECNDAKNLIQNLPAGFIGNPHATPQCTLAGLSLAQCPVDSQIGMVAILAGTPSPSTGYVFFPLYNMVPTADEAGLIAFRVGGSGPIFTVIGARTGGDYGLRTVTIGLPRQNEFVPYQITTYLWGVPADPSHDALRFGFGSQSAIFECMLGNEQHDPRPYLERGEFPPPSICNSEPRPPIASSSPLTPFLSNPTRCIGPLTPTFETLAFDHGTDFVEGTFPAITGCDQLSFNPSLAAKPTTTEADSASGLDANLSVPQFVSATTPSPSEIREATVTLPQGFSINPNAADGKVTCSDIEARFGTENAAQCPEYSKIGTLTIENSALPAPIPGYLYLGDPLPGNRYRVILVADGFGTHIKLPGSVIPDPQTGQLTLSFQNLPQSPLTDFNLHVFGSERGILATPTQCGTYAVHSTFTPWDESLADQSATQFFSIDSGPDGTPCPSRPRGISPSFSAASAGNTGGAHSPFGVEISRADGQENLSGIKITTPPGFSATLKGIPYCPEQAIASLTTAGYTGSAELSSPACPSASQVGSAVVGAGAGSRPLYTSGKVYLAGPYKGAPLSLLVVVPAVSGPYDLGNAVVRVALQIDPTTAQVTAVSDPLPQILEGIPLRTRSIQVNLNRPGFTLNPTNCEPLDVEAAISGDEGSTAQRTSRFQASNCATLPYHPKLHLRLSGGVGRLGHPAIHATFTAGEGEANTQAVTTLLPKGELLDNSHFGAVCTRPEFTAGTCPTGSLVGNATVTTPLLGQPLSGNVYLLSNPNHGLPDLALALKGQVNITLISHIDSVNERYRAQFQSVPDVPVSTFSLNLLGGSKGLLQNSEPLCGRSERATVWMTGQNGAKSKEATRLQTPCGGTNGRHAK